MEGLVLQRIFILILLLLLNSLASAASYTEGEIRQTFRGTPDIPDSLAFNVYSDLVHQILHERSLKGAEAFIIFSFDLEDSPEGRSIARTVVKVLDQAHHSIALKLVENQIDTFCNPMLASDATDEIIFKAMDDQDDSDEATIESVYLESMSAIPEDIKPSLMRALATTKEGMSYTKLRHRESWHNSRPDADMRAVVVDICSEETTKKNLLKESTGGEL